MTPERGGTFFHLNPRHPSFDLPETNTRKNKTPRDYVIYYEHEKERRPFACAHLGLDGG